MFTVVVVLLVGIAVVAVVRSASGADTTPTPNQQLLDDFQKLLNKERSSTNPDHTIYRYLWWDMPENYEFVNRLIARGYWRSGFTFTNGRDSVWFECSPAMGWTAYRTTSRGKKVSLWLPAKFPQHFAAFLG